MNMNFENKLKELEDIVDALERGNVPLEDAIQIFRRGMLLSKQLQDILNQSVLVLVNAMQANGAKTQGNPNRKDY